MEDQLGWVKYSRGPAQLDVADGSAQLGVVEGSSAGFSGGSAKLL